MDPQDNLPLDATDSAEEPPHGTGAGSAADPVPQEEVLEGDVPEVAITVLRASPWGKPGDMRLIPAAWLDSATQYGEAELAS